MMGARLPNDGGTLAHDPLLKGSWIPCSSMTSKCSWAPACPSALPANRSAGVWCMRAGWARAGRISRGRMREDKARGQGAGCARTRLEDKGQDARGQGLCVRAASPGRGVASSTWRCPPRPQSRTCPGNAGRPSLSRTCALPDLRPSPGPAPARHARFRPRLQLSWRRFPDAGGAC
jgi:hypothetical protein